MPRNCQRSNAAAVRLYDATVGRYVILRIAEAAVPKELSQKILRVIHELRPRPARAGRLEGGSVIRWGGVGLSEEKKGQIGGSNVV
jgi:hypothetical protein